MALDVSRLEQIGRYQVIEARPARPGLFLARVHDTATGEAARLLLLLPDELEPETRALLASLAVHAPLAEAATEGDYAYLALPPSADTTPEMAALIPATLAPLPPPTPFLIRIRPFAAAFVLVLACLLGLQIADNLAWQQQSLETVQAPSDWGGGSPGIASVPVSPVGRQSGGIVSQPSAEQQGDSSIPMSPVGRQGGGTALLPEQPSGLAIVPPPGLVNPIVPPVLGGAVPQAAAAELPATPTPTATPTTAPTETATPAPTVTPTRTAIPAPRQVFVPPAVQPQYIPPQQVYRTQPQQSYIPPQQYSPPSGYRPPSNGGYTPPSGGYRPPSPPSRPPSGGSSWNAPVKAPSAWLR